MRIQYKGTAPKKHKNAVAAFCSGNYKLARKEWEDMDDPIALKGMGYICLRESLFREAASYFEELIQSAAHDPEAYNGLALAYLADDRETQALEVLLDATDNIQSPLLEKTLEAIKKSKGATAIAPLMVVTMPSSGVNVGLLLKNTTKKLGWKLIPIAIALVIGLLFWSYPYLRNASLNFNFRNRGAAMLPSNPTIIGMAQILEARENLLPPMDEATALAKVAQLRDLISANKPNQARILANEILAAEGSEAIKERAYVLEGFIGEPNYENIDYTPSYAELSSRPFLYKGVVVRWEGVASKVSHQGRSATSFDLLIGYDGSPQVQGIAAVQIQGMEEIANGNRLTVIGLFKGIDPNNKAVVTPYRIIR
ncbi:MAG: tetratricopeptide repeat protein [Brevinema sp.]